MKQFDDNKKINKEWYCDNKNVIYLENKKKSLVLNLNSNSIFTLIRENSKTKQLIFGFSLRFHS
jgi:hypothetical protein